MIDEWCEAQIDKLCAFLPAYFAPRMTWFYSTRAGWRLYLYAKGFARSVLEPFSRIQWIEKEEDLAPEDPGEEDDPELARLDPEMRRQFKAWNDMEEAQRDHARKRREKLRSPQEKLRIWWAGRHERAKVRDEKWAAREAAADARADRLMHRAGPLIEAVKKSRFVFFLLMTAVSALGVLSCGGGGMAYMAASLCAMWLAASFESGYHPVCEGVRQRYLAVMILRGASSLMLLPMYFGAYARHGVSSNVVLQSAMIVLLFAHAAFYIPLVAFNRRQMLLPRVLSGLLGVVPALTAAAAIALAASGMGQTFPLPVYTMLGAVGALLAFAADRMTTLTELGGIRLRFAPLLMDTALMGGYLLMMLGAWLGCAAL